tara:strand:- start:676 stop:828 length:153 start_codon:yes stop_codon:yes gene_type:complete
MKKKKKKIKNKKKKPLAQQKKEIKEFWQAERQKNIGYNQQKTILEKIVQK